MILASGGVAVALLVVTEVGDAVVTVILNTVSKLVVRWTDGAIAVGRNRARGEKRSRLDWRGEGGADSETNRPKSVRAVGSDGKRSKSVSAKTWPDWSC